MSNISSESIKDYNEWLPILRKLEIEANELGVDFEVFAKSTINHLAMAMYTYPDNKQKYQEDAAKAIYKEFYKEHLS